MRSAAPILVLNSLLFPPSFIATHVHIHTSNISFLLCIFILFFDQIFFTRCFPRGRPSFGVIIPSLFEIHPTLPAVSEGNSIRRFVDFCCRCDIHFFSAVILRSRAPAAGFKHLLVFFNFFRATRARGEWKKSERKALLRDNFVGSVNQNWTKN